MYHNSVQLVGNLGKDPELKQTKSGKETLTLSVATNEKTQEGKDNTVWHNVRVYGKLATVLAPVGKKGDRVFVSGKLTYWETDDKNIPFIVVFGFGHSVIFFPKKNNEMKEVEYEDLENEVPF